MYRQKHSDIEPGRHRVYAPTAHAASPVEGFGLIELLVTLSLVAIISTLAVPSFVHMIDQARLRSAASNFTAALYGARSHAIRSGNQTLVCPSADGKTCDTSSYKKGWIVKETGKEKRLHTWPAPKVTVSPKSGNSQFFTNGDELQYWPDGQAGQSPDSHSFGSIMFCVDHQSRIVSVSYSGRIKVVSKSC